MRFLGYNSLKANLAVLIISHIGKILTIQLILTFPFIGCVAHVKDFSVSFSQAINQQKTHLNA